MDKFSAGVAAITGRNEQSLEAATDAVIEILERGNVDSLIKFMDHLGFMVRSGGADEIVAKFAALGLSIAVENAGRKIAAAI